MSAPKILLTSTSITEKLIFAVVTACQRLYRPHSQHLKHSRTFINGRVHCSRWMSIAGFANRPRLVSGSASVSEQTMKSDGKRSLPSQQFCKRRCWTHPKRWKHHPLCTSHQTRVTLTGTWCRRLSPCISGWKRVERESSHNTSTLRSAVRISNAHAPEACTMEGIADMCLDRVHRDAYLMPCLMR